ncbi:TIGR03086 family protein [Streptomyces sp. N2-109]|uniref:TIGR03086 family protein n=1 Tax=Streptomyces gossypii TaxID=2883101 RepID=A0ABT2JYB5_9ACTN|nr:TIGR03086 family metal-binding protein [Streptomyces gossypii]MCT2592880.1 TIGR03086 family protein [Streptomyces gossypii]
MTDTAHSAETAPLDLRTGFARAVALCGRTLAAVRPEQLDGPTPCPDYTVRQLSGHLVAVMRRVSVIGRDGDLFTVPDVADELADDEYPLAWEAAAHEAEEVWSAPAVLDRPHRGPAGEMPGTVLLGVYTTEFTLHTWDLAKATGQIPSWDQEVLGSLVRKMKLIPAEPRGGRVPFGPVVAVPADASDIDKVVAWHGRQP